MVSILQIAHGGAIKTRIMYGALLSYPQLKEYLELLMQNGLLEHTDVNGRYHTTEKGTRFLEMYREVGHMFTKEREMDMAQ